MDAAGLPETADCDRNRHETTAAGQIRCRLRKSTRLGKSTSGPLVASHDNHEVFHGLDHQGSRYDPVAVPRAVRARLARGELSGFKRGGQWFIPRRALPLTDDARHALRAKADDVRAAVEGALPAAAGGRGGGGRFGLAEMEAFRAGLRVYHALTGEARDSARGGLLALAEAHHQYAPADKHDALCRARAAFAHAAAYCLISDSSADLTVIEHGALPRIAGLIRWVDQLPKAA